MDMYTTKKKSNFWYVLPIFLGIIGGVIVYLVLKKSDSSKAKKCLLFGMGISVFGIILIAMIGNNKSDTSNDISSTNENVEVEQVTSKTYPPNTIGGMPIEPGVSYMITEDGATKVEEDNQRVWKDYKEISNETTNYNKFDKQKLAELKDSIINDPLYDVVFDPVVVRQAEKGILLSQKAFKGVLNQCNSIESYSDYLVFTGGLELVQDEVVQSLEEINDAMISLELSGYDNHHTIGPLIKNTRQLAEDVGNCIIDVQNKYDN